MGKKWEKPSGMRYKLCDQATTNSQNRGLPSESIYRIPARQSRQLGDRCGVRGVALAGDQGPRDAPSLAAFGDRGTGRDDALWRLGAGAAVGAAVWNCAAPGSRLAAVQAACAVSRVRPRAGTDLHTVYRWDVPGGSGGAAGERGGAPAGGSLPDTGPDHRGRFSAPLQDC